MVIAPLQARGWRFGLSTGAGHGPTGFSRGTRMKHLATLCATGAILVGCAASSVVEKGDGSSTGVSGSSSVSLDRIVAYRADSFTDPALDVSRASPRAKYEDMSK